MPSYNISKYILTSLNYHFTEALFILPPVSFLIVSLIVIYSSV